MNGWNKKNAKMDTQTREALTLAHKELCEIARTKGLSPDGEKARDLCSDALQKMDRGSKRSRSH